MPRDPGETREIAFKHRPVYARLLDAEIRKGEILFNLLPSRKVGLSEMEDYLTHEFTDGRDEPIYIHNDGHKLTIRYFPDTKRDLDRDMRVIVDTLTDLNVPITLENMERIERAFKVFKKLTPEATGSAVAAEEARRAVRRKPGGRGSP